MSCHAEIVTMVISNSQWNRKKQSNSFFRCYFDAQCGNSTTVYRKVANTDISINWKSFAPNN